MAEPEQEQPRLDDDTGEEEASSPFDHPAFLPVLLWGLAFWFGYDGWFNPKIESIAFNRWGFGILLVLAIYFTAQSVRESRAREGEGPQPD